MRPVYTAVGLASVALGVVGILLPLLPTVPFMILAAFCFARANPAWERRLLDDPRFGPHIDAWRKRGAISRRGKTAALAMLCLSAALGFAVLDGLMALVPLGVALITGSWIATRPS